MAGESNGQGSRRRLLWLLVGHGAVGLATVGAFLPVLPTVPFLLVAGWAYARGNPELRERMRNDPRFGRAVRDWQDRGAIPLKAKITAVAGMASGFGVLVLSSPGLAVLGGVGLIMVAVGAYIVSRPASPTPDRRHGPGQS